MRVVGGTHRGRRLRAPAGAATRPTADRVREALFSMLEPVQGLRVLDLFAGSGALGIEAASRGAAAVTLVDTSRAAIATITRNLRDLELEATVIRRDAVAYLGAHPGPFDLVLVDPPYSSALSLAGPLTDRLPPVLSPGARIVTESDKRQPLDLALPLVRERTYGDTRVAIHRGA
jgi:16S rRNA (guanine966-N2)-methyltransferase